MKKNMYKQPKTEVLGLDGEYLMQTMKVSEGEGGGGVGHLPGRKGDFIP